MPISVSEATIIPISKRLLPYGFRLYIMIKIIKKKIILIKVTEMFEIRRRIGQSIAYIAVMN